MVCFSPSFLKAHIDDGGFPGLFPVECCNLNGDERGIIGPALKASKEGSDLPIEAHKAG